MATSTEETRYRHLLQELAGDLTSDEVRELIFLLRLHIKGKKIRSDIKSDATKLLTELEKLNCIGIDNLTLLVELFQLIGRIDLKNKIVKEPGHRYHVSEPEPKINEFMRILWKFGQKLDSDDLKDAKFILGWTRYSENIENIWQMFEKAFESGYVEENNINSVIEFAKKIKQVERLKSVMNEKLFTYPSSNYSPGITSTPDMSQQEHLYTRVGITPRKEERHWSPEQPRPHWPPEQPRPENNLPHYSPNFGINRWLSLSYNQDFQHTSVPYEDDMSIPLSAAFRNSHVARDLPASNTGAKTDPYDLVMEPVEKYQRQDASARQKDVGHETNLRDINTSVKLLESQNTIEEIIEGNKSQNEVKDAREMSVTGSSSDNVNLTSGQTAPAGTQFKGEVGISHLNTNEDPVSKGDKQKEVSEDIQTGSGYQEAIHFRERVNKYHKVALTGEQSVETKTGNFRGSLQDVINVEPKSEKASKRSEQKEASQEIRSSGWDEKQMLELNVSGSQIDIPNEAKENKSIHNEEIYVRDPDSLGVTSPLLINNQNEASPGIKMDITEDLKDISETPNTNQTPSVETLTLGQTVQTGIGSFIGPVDAAPTPIFRLDSKGASQIAEQKEASQEIISSTLIEEKISKLNLSKESNDSLNETRENNDLIISEHADIPYGQDKQNEKRMPGNINQSNNDATSESKQDSVEQTSTSDENSHVGNGREGYSSFGTSLFSSSPARTSESEGGDVNEKQEAIDGKSTERRFLLESSGKVEPNLTLQMKKKRLVSCLNNPRSGQIIEVDVEEMENHCCWDKEIGQGSFGTVYEANIGGKNTGKCVIKRIEVKEDEQYLKSYDREVYHGRILHPYIISIVARAEKVDDISRSPSAMYLMYPNMINGNVHTNIEKEEHGEESRKLLCDKFESNCTIWLRCIYQVAHALDYLHNPGKNSSRRPVYHRDLTSRNILFDEDFNVKVCDFGLAVEGKYSSTDASVTTKHISSAYHPRTMDPERYSAFDDVYSFSVVVLEILTGKVVKGQDHFSSYKIPGGDTCLLRDLKKRAERIKVARWANKNIRNHLAKTAHDVLLEGKKEVSKRKKIDAMKFVQEPDVLIESRIRYQMPRDPGTCVSCNVNPAANLSLKGEKCDASCKPFCVYCLSDQYNQLVCPRHGSSRPPFGDHVYGVFVAGNHVQALHGNLLFNGNDPETYANIAGIFTKDAKKLVNVLTSKFPLILGAREEHLLIVTPKEPGKECLMMEDLEKAFNESEKSIREALSNNPHHGDGKRIKNSLFVFYFTGHGDKESGLYLGGKGETINASTDWLKKMLHEKLLVDQILVILDCCHAAEQDFAKAKGISGFGILQLSSCDRDQKSICNQGNWKGSYFSHFLCQALRGDNFVRVGDGHLLKQCQHCEDRNREHFKPPCEEFTLSRTDSQSVTLSSVKDYIRRHYEQLNLPMNLKEHCSDIEEIHIGYFKPEETSMSIFLKGSKNGETYTFRSAPRSMSHLKKDIVRYIEENKIQCEIFDIHEFHKKSDISAKNEKTKHLIKKTSSLVAIHPRVGKEKQEQTDLKDLWKIRPCGRALEAQIRDSVMGLKNGPVKIIGLDRGMTDSLLENYVDENLTIEKDYIHVQMKESILSDIYGLMDSSKNISKEFKKLLNKLHQILQDCMCAHDSDGIRVKDMKFKLYKEFAILGGE